MTRPERRFGLELEFTQHRDYNFDSLGFLLTTHFSKRHQTFLAQARYGASNGTYWELKLDGSCGWELVTPAMTWSLWPEVEEVCQLLRTRGFTVNHRCGVHVHHDVVDFNAARLRKLFRLWLAVEPIAIACCAPDRFLNPFSMPLGTLLNLTTWPGVLRATSTAQNLHSWVVWAGRRLALNLIPYWQRGTIEIRLHHGSLNTEELQWWVTFTQGLVQLSKRRYRQATIQALYNSSTLADRIAAFTRLALRYSDSEEFSEVVSTLDARIRTYRQPSRLSELWSHFTVQGLT